MTYLAEKLPCEYAPRPDNSHAKAGNLNYRIVKTISKIIAVFDADFVPNNVTVNHLAQTTTPI